MIWLISSIFGLIGGIINLTFGLIWIVLTVIARWMVFQKAGEAGWKSIVPFYRDYTAYKIGWTTSMFWVWLVFTVIGNMAENAANGNAWSMYGIIGTICGLATVVIALGYSLNMARSFGKGTAFAIGLWVLEPVFMMILGFGSAQYQRVRIRF